MEAAKAKMPFLPNAPLQSNLFRLRTIRLDFQIALQPRA
jgi:hypothetical protein